MVKHGKEQNTAHREEQRRAAQQENRKKKFKSYIGWGITAAIVLFFIFWFASSAKVDTSGFAPITFATHEKDHVIVIGDGRNVLIEYSDFQCPACAQYHALIKQFLADDPNVTFIYRHFPLKSIHRNAAAAAVAAEAAGNQGKFFEMHDLLFERQSVWNSMSAPKSYFSDLAEELRLDVSTFNADMNDPQVIAWVEFNYQSAVNYNLRGTPSFFLNGQMIQFSSLEELQARLR